MKILGLIPARGGSKGVPRKNIKKLKGKPLIGYSIEAALSCPKLDKVVVSTDDESIRQISEKLGAEAPFLRPAELATDQSPTIDTVLHAIDFYEKNGIQFDTVCLLQPTCPFRTSGDIEKAIEKFEATNADSLISVREVPHQFNPHWIFEAEEHSQYLKIATGEKEIISRRQELPKSFYRDGFIYLTKTKVLKKNRSLYGEKITWIQLNNPHPVNIDNLDDWEKAEQILSITPKS